MGEQLGFASLMVGMGVDTSAFQQGLGTAEGQTEQFANKLTNQMNMPQVAKPVENALGKKVPAAAKKSSEALDNLKKKLIAFGTVAGLTLLAKQAINLTKELVSLGAASEVANNVFSNLAESMGSDSVTAIDLMRNSTRGMVDDLSLMQASGKMMAMGLADTAAGIARLQEVSVQLGAAMGEGPTAAMENFSLLLANQSLPRLDTFGISSGKVKARMAELKEETSSLTREQTFLQATMEQAEIAMGKIGDQSDTTSGQIARTEAAWKNMKTAMGEAIVGMFASEEMGWLAELFNAITEGISTTQAASSEFEAFATALGQQREAGEMSADGYKTAVEALAALDYAYGTGSISIDEYRAGLVELSAEAARTSGVMASSFSFDTFGPATGSYEEFKASLRTVADPGIMAANDFRDSWESAAQQTAALVGPALSDAIAGSMGGVSDALSQSTELLAQWASDSNAIMTESGENQAAALEEGQGPLTEILQEHLEERAADSEAYAAESAAAEAQYQADLLVLQQAGLTEQAADLTAKYTEEQALSASKFQQDNEIKTQAMLQQQYVAAVSYQAQLADQRDFVIRSMMLAVEKQIDETGVMTAAQSELLDILSISGSEQLQMEYDTKKASLAATESWAKGTLTAGQTVAEATELLQKAQDDAAGKAAAIKAKLDSFKISMPPIGKLDVSNIAKSAGAVGSATKRATAPATAKLKDVQADIADVIGKAQESIYQLMGFDVPEGINEKFEQLADFLHLAIQTMYAAVGEMDKETAKAAKEIGKAILTIVTAYAEFQKVLNAAGRGQPFPDIRPYLDQFKVMIDAAMGTLIEIVDRIGEKTIKKTQKSATRLRRILDAIIVDYEPLSRANVPDLSEFADMMLMVVDQALNIVLTLERDVGAASIERAARLSDSLAHTIELMTTDLSGIGVWDTPPDPKTWADTFTRIIDIVTFTINDVVRTVGQWDIENAAARTGTLSTLLGLIATNLDAMSTLPDDFSLKIWQVELTEAIGVVIDVIEEITSKIDVTRQGDAASRVSDLTSILGMIVVDLSKMATVSEMPSMKLWKAQVFAAIEAVIELSEELERKLTAKRIQDAAKATEFLGDLADMLGIELNDTIAAGEAFDPEGYVTSLKEALTELVDGINDLERDLGTKAITDAASIAEALGELTDLLDIDLNREALSLNWADDFEDYKESLDTAIRGIASWLADLTTDAEFMEMLDNAGLIPEQIGALADLLGIDMSAVLGTADQFDATGYAEAVEESIKAILVMIARLTTGPYAITQAQLDTAATFSEAVGAVLELLGVSFDSVRVEPTFYGDLTNYIAAIETSMILLMASIEKMQRSWSVAELTLGGDYADQVNRVLELLGMGGIITDMEDFKDTHFRENVKEMAADLDWATGEIVTLLVGPGGLEERWGDALPGAIRMAQHVAAVFEAIASVAESIESAADNGGIDIEAGWAMLNQLVALAGGFKAIQAVPTFGDLSNIGPGELGPGPQDHFLGAGDGGDNGPWDVKVIGWKELPPVTVELTINVAGDNGKVVHFTEQAKVGETLRRELSASL